MAIDHKNIKSCLVLDITGSNFFKKFTTKGIEDIFIKIGKLEKGCFNISKEYFSDGSYRINFHYPTDMNNTGSSEFFDVLLEKLRNMTLEEFNFSLEYNSN